MLLLLPVILFPNLPPKCLRSARGGEATRWQRYLQSGRLSWGCERGWGCCPGGGELLGDPQRVILKNRLDSRALLFQRHEASPLRQRGDSTRAHRLCAQHLHFHVSPPLKTLLTHRIARVMPKLSLVSLLGLNFKGCIPRGGSGPGAEGSGDPPAPVPISVSLYQGCSQSSGALISLRRGAVGMTKSSWL